MKQTSEREFFISKVVSLNLAPLPHVTLAYPSNTAQNDRGNLHSQEAARTTDDWNNFFAGLVKLQPNQTCDLYLDCKFLDLYKLGQISQAVQVLDIKFKHLAIHNVESLIQLLNINAPTANSMTCAPAGDLWKSIIEVEDLSKSALSCKPNTQLHWQKVSEFQVQIQKQIQKDLSSGLTSILSAAEKVNFTNLPTMMFSHGAELVFGVLKEAKCSDLAISTNYYYQGAAPYLYTLISSNHYIKNLDISSMHNTLGNEMLEMVIAGCVDNPAMGIKYAPAYGGINLYKEFADFRIKDGYVKSLLNLAFNMKKGVSAPDESGDLKVFCFPQEVINMIFNEVKACLPLMVSDGMTILNESDSFDLMLKVLGSQAPLDSDTSSS